MATLDERARPSPHSPGGPAPGGAPAGPAAPTSSGGLGFLAVFFVGALAFLLASSPARNSDLWGHLAAGRSLVGGAYPAGAGSESPAGLAGRTWLYDLLCYGVYSALGGAGLVFLKALLVTGLALVLLRLSRTGSGWRLPAACTALALLAMGTRLLLQPAIVSYLLLALALWLVAEEKSGGDWAASPRPPRAWLPPWPLLVLFVVWANTDGWFVLGLATVALVWLGRLLDMASEAGRGRPAILVSLAPRLLVSLSVLSAACLLNPSHVYAFALPPELAWWGPDGSAGPLVPWQAMSPFEAGYFKNFGLSPAALAYFPLLALGLLAFVLNFPRLPWQRFLPWLGLALLSAFRAKAIPFFAVVAGPVLAWELQEYFSSHLDGGRRQSPSRRGVVALGRVGLGVLGVALLVCAWPGWLQGPPFEPRRWAVETAPSLERGATTTRLWHREGKLGPDTRGLYLSRPTAHAFAWFCPEEKGVLIDRLAADVLAAPGAPDWHRAMRSVGINHLILYDPDPGRVSAALGGLLADPGQWPLLYWEGDLAVFGWRDPERLGEGDPFRAWQLDLGRLAFRPAEDKKAPPRPADREPQGRRWWDAFWKSLPPRSIDHAEAALNLFHAETLRRSAPARHQAAWEESQAAALVGAAGGRAGPTGPAGGLLDAHLRLVLLRPQVPDPAAGVDRPPVLDRLAVVLQKRFTRRRDDTPPALLYLAVRAARRALAGDPDDANAYLILGESYVRLLQATRERAWAANLPELVQLRRAQASAALNRAVALKPDYAQAHLRLFELYRDMGYLDLAVKHLDAYLKLAHAAGPPPGVPAEEFREQEAQFAEGLGRLAREVADREDGYTLASSGKPVRERAVLALERGLAGKALDMLLASDVAAFGHEGTAVELELLLNTGRSRDVWEWTSPQHREALGPLMFHWLRARGLAASGDYARAQEECVLLARSLSVDEQDHKPMPVRQAMAVTVGRAVLNGQSGGETVSFLLRRIHSRTEFFNRLTDLRARLRREADVTVLRGLIALEEGSVGEAEFAFREALAVWEDEAAAASGAGLDFGGRAAAQGCLEWLE